MKSERDVSLDAMRGIAALAVFGWHGMLGFYPEASGFLGEVPIGHTARSQLWFAAVNGPAAVAFFFVLSGFALSRAGLTTGRSDSLARGLIKRWPRLAGPTVLAALGSWLLFATGGYVFQPAAALTHSPWLAHFAGAYPRPPSQPSLVGAVLEGSVLTFVRGDASYDSSLWTMAYEFYGSLMIYALGFLLVHRRGLRVRIVAIMAAAIACGFAAPALTPFVIGFALAAFLPPGGLRAPPALAAGCVAAALLACGYTAGALGVYAPLTAVYPAWLPIPILYAAAGATLITAARSWPAMNRLLSRGWGGLAGELSFPFYLVHVPILCSIGAATFLSTGSKPAALAVSLAVSFGAAWGLALLNRWWLERLNVGAARVLASIERRQFASLGAAWP